MAYQWFFNTATGLASAKANWNRDSSGSGIHPATDNWPFADGDTLDCNGNTVIIDYSITAAVILTDSTN